MEYKNEQEERYKEQLLSMIEQLAKALNDGYTLELSKSRSGIKLFLVRKRHVVLSPNRKMEG